MDTKLQIKEEEFLPDDADPQNETKFFRKVVTIKRTSDAVLVDDHCDETEIKSEAPFTKHLVKRIKFEAVTCPDNWKIDGKAVIDEQTLISDSSSQSRRERPSEEPVTRLGKFNTGHEMDNKIEIKEEPLWLETETSPTDNNIKDGDCPSVKSSRLVPGIKNGNITCSNNFEMDPIKGEESFPDDVASPNETEFFPKAITMKRDSDAVLVDDCCDVPIKTEIKSEAPFTKHFIKQIKSEAVTCSSSSWELDRKAVIDEETFISDFGSQSEEELLPEDPVAKLGKFNSGEEMGNKIEIKEEPLWPETDTSDMHDDIKDGDFPPLNSSRLCEQEVSSVVTGKSLLIAAEVSGRGTNFYPGKDHTEYECQKSDDTEIPNAQERAHLKHNTLNHKSKRQHTCKACSKSYPYLSQLIRHKWIHEGKKPYKCKTCDKSFTVLGTLKTHYFIHEVKKPHQCKTCDKSFGLLSYLKRHSLIHDGKKPHQCKACDKSFARLGNLNQHSLIHEGKKPHQCKTCDNRFTQLSALKSHYLIHEGKTPHQCKTCDKRITQLGNLKRHSLIHEGKRPHQCKTCNKNLTHLSALKRYYLTR